VGWIQLAQNKIKWWVLMDTVMYLLVPKGEEISQQVKDQFLKNNCSIELFLKMGNRRSPKSLKLCYRNTKYTRKLFAAGQNLATGHNYFRK
jgi:hypothetical protein